MKATCVAVAMVVAVLVLVLLLARDGSVERADAVERARVEGYAECLSDVSGVIAGGGGIDEVLAFARRKSDAGFAR